MNPLAGHGPALLGAGPRELSGTDRSELDVRPEFDVSRTVAVVGLPKGSRLQVVAATRPCEYRMVECVEKFRLQHEAYPLGDRDPFGQRHVVISLVRPVNVEDLAKRPRRGVRF